MKPTVLLQGNITGEMLDRAWVEIESYRKQGEEDALLIINSKGGNGSKALEFIERMADSGLEFSAKIYHAESAAVLIALSAKCREIVRNGRLVIHLGSVEVESCDISENGTIPTGFKIAAEKIRERTFTLMARAGIAEQGPYMDTLLATNRLTLTSDECLKLGIVQRVIG